MKDACGGASGDDEKVGGEESNKHNTVTNGNKSNDSEQNPISEEHSANETSPNSKESCTDSNAECETISSKEEKNAKTLQESRNCLPPLGRRSSRLQGKQPKLTEIITTSDEEENLESEEDLSDKEIKRKKKGRNTLLLRQSKDQSLTPAKSFDSKPRLKIPAKERKSKKDIAVSKLPNEFSSGSFVVIKSDFHSTTTPAIWKIDGKALLQKYVHFDQDGQIMYKNTSTYSGWTLSNKDQYYPAAVEVKSQKRNETIVKFKRELITVDDSD
ncbi:uncharacterized protein LOC117650328 isoform X2 [Thrips palmi]|nr:uncharacterized protein LOC117650328 isoform X2 [Thrips palmi]XP_034249578.1 uncharacterized protein LOC117650328 isoform X2 [Thrips palmi]